MRKEDSTTYRFINEKQQSDVIKVEKKSVIEKLTDFNLYDFSDSVIYALIAITVIFVFYKKFSEISSFV